MPPPTARKPSVISSFFSSTFFSGMPWAERRIRSAIVFFFLTAICLFFEIALGGSASFFVLWPRRSASRGTAQGFYFYRWPYHYFCASARSRISTENGGRGKKKKAGREPKKKSGPLAKKTWILAIGQRGLVVYGVWCSCSQDAGGNAGAL